MARRTFGGSAADIVTDSAGNFTTDSGTVWTAQTGGTQITDLLDMNGNPLSSGVVVTGANPVGLVQFQGPNDGTNEVWVDFGGGRVRLVAHDGKASLGNDGKISAAVVPDLAGDYAATGTLAVNVKHPDFGAAGDGLVDDTSAIQAAIDSFGYTWAGSVFNTTYAPRGGEVYLPPGDYRITSKLRLAPNVTLRGAGKVGYYGRAADADPTDGTVIIVDIADTGGYAVDTSPYQAGGTRADDITTTGASVSGNTYSAMDSVCIRDVTFYCKTENSTRLFNLAASQQFLLSNVASYRFLVSLRASATWMSAIRDCQFYSGFRGAEFMHSVNNLVLDNVTFSRVGMTAVDTQATNESDAGLTALGALYWQDSAGILCYDAAYITGSGITIEGYNRTLVAATYSNIDIESLWVETSSMLVTNNYSVVDVRLKYGYALGTLLTTVNGRTRLENVAWNDEQSAYTTDYTAVVGSVGATDINDTSLIGFAPKVAGDSTGNLHMIYKAADVAETRGTWTPSLQFGGASAGTQVNTGYYYRVGDLIFASFYVTMATKGAATGAATITGLPRAAKNNFGHAGSGVVTFGFAAPVAGQLLTVDANTSAINVSGKTNTDFANGTDIRGTVTYTCGGN